MITYTSVCNLETNKHNGEKKMIKELINKLTRLMGKSITIQYNTI